MLVPSRLPRGQRGSHPPVPRRPALTHGEAEPAAGAERSGAGRNGAERGPAAGAGPGHVAAALPPAGQPEPCSRPTRPYRGRGSLYRPGSDAEGRGAEPDPGGW